MCACIAIAGSLDESAYRLHAAGFDALFSLCPGPVSLQQAIENAAPYLSQTTEQVIRCQQLGRDKPLCHEDTGVIREAN